MELTRNCESKTGTIPTLYNNMSPAGSIDSQGEEDVVNTRSTKKLKLRNLRNLHSMENKFHILKRTDQSIMKKIETQRKQAEILMRLKQTAEQEKKRYRQSEESINKTLESAKLMNFERKQKHKLNISFVNQSLAATKKSNHLQVRKEKDWIKREVESQKSRDLSAKRSSASSFRM